MNLQTLEIIYFTLGIIVMVLGLLFLIALTITVFYIKRKVDNIHQEIEDRLKLIIDQTIRPAEQAIGVGAAVAETAIHAARRVLSRKKGK